MHTYLKGFAALLLPEKTCGDARSFCAKFITMMHIKKAGYVVSVGSLNKSKWYIFK